MERKFLKELGLEDEMIDRIMAEHGKTTQRLRGDQEALSAECKQLKESLKERDASLETLKKTSGDAEALRKQVETLQAEHKEKDKAHVAEMTRFQKTAALKLAVAGDAHDPDDIITRINLDDIEMDGQGNVKSDLSKIIGPIREAKPYLFKEQKKASVADLDGVVPGDPGPGRLTPSEGSAAGFESRLIEARKNGDNLAAIQIKQDAAAKGIILN